jgi:hypothetical protein
VKSGNRHCYHNLTEIISNVSRLHHTDNFELGRTLCKAVTPQALPNALFGILRQVRTCLRYVLINTLARAPEETKLLRVLSA